MTLLAVFLILHGLIHVLGFAKAFGLAALPQLAQPITRPMGLLWLFAAVLFAATATSLYLLPRWWWAVGITAVTVSTVAVINSWGDAKFGALANLVALAAVLYGFLASGPWSLRAAYDRDLNGRLTHPVASDKIQEADLAPFPPPVQRYLRTSGVVGTPRIHNFRVRMRGRIRSGPAARWIPFSAEQHNFVDQPARLFYLTGSMFAIPVQGYHRYVGSSATMVVKAAALVPVARASGAEMTRAETVTLFNDMCVMAPATLVGATIAWEPVDAHCARAQFTNAGHTIRAELVFNDAGELVNFWSDDRYQTSPDGKARRVRWSTPLGAYRSFEGIRLASRGEGRWHEADGEYAYIELTIDDVAYNVTAGAP